MKTIQQDLRSNNLSLDEAITVAQNRPLWRLMSAFVTQEEEADIAVGMVFPSCAKFWNLTSAKSWIRHRS